MNEQEQIRVLVEMDEWKAPATDQDGVQDLVLYKGPLKVSGDGCRAVPPDYLHSYDAIIPLIQKLQLSSVGWFDLQRCTPAQLAESLLRATDRWKE